MKNLLTLLLLVISLLASGQSDSQSLEVEIQYWKSIAESNDTVAYREYLNRYGENGLYYDEAITRIALLKTSGKQVQPKNIECCFYSRYTSAVNIKYVIRFDAEQGKVWLKPINYDTVRSNLAVSRDFYEDQSTIALSRGTQKYKDAIWNDKKAIEEAEYARKHEKNRRKKSKIIQKAEQAKSPDDYKNAWTTDEEYQYDPMKSTSARVVYFKRECLHQFDHIKYDYYTDNYGKTRHNKRHVTLYVYSDDQYNDKYYEHKDNKKVWDGGWLTDEYEKTKTMQGYRYIAISKDKSSFIMWFEEDDNLDGVILEKREYKRVPKEELLPKAVNYDFLNE